MISNTSPQTGIGNRPQAYPPSGKLIAPLMINMTPAKTPPQCLFTIALYSLTLLFFLCVFSQ